MRVLAECPGCGQFGFRPVHDDPETGETCEYTKKIYDDMQDEYHGR